MTELNKDFVWLPQNVPFLNETEVHPHDKIDKASLYHSADGGSTEFEILTWLHSTIRTFKPNIILETGAWNGIGTIALAHACKLNNFGKVISLETLPEQCQIAQKLVDQENLQSFVEIHNVNSLDFLKQNDIRFDLCFFDSDTKVRPEELEILLSKNLIPEIAVFHDTSPYRLETWAPKSQQDKYRADIMQFTKHPKCTGYFDMSLSRGFFTLFFEVCNNG